MLVASILGLAVVTVGLGPAQAIGYDHGWTQNNNNNYPGSTSNPECQPHCVGYNDDATHGVPYANVNVVNNLGGNIVWPSSSSFNAWGWNRVYGWLDPIQSGAIGNLNSPYYAQNNYGATVTLQFANLGNQSGYAYWYTINSPPHNHGCCQELTLAGGYVDLNSNYPTIAYTSGGTPLGWWNGHYWVDVRFALDHELGHTIGLGHTTGGNETMHQLPNQFVGAGVGDFNGTKCIYQLQNCG
jgi:hypothetical protein